MSIPENVQTILHYANATPTETTWRRIVLGPFAKFVLAPGMEPPLLPTMGITSLEELERILADFREVLDRWVKAESPYSSELHEALRLTVERSNLSIKAWALSPTTERLFEEWDTENQSFPEMLYSYLIMVLRDVSFRALHRCAECGKFFFDPSKRAVLYCSKTCQNRTMARRFREKKKTAPAARKKPSKKSRGTKRTAK